MKKRLLNYLAYMRTYIPEDHTLDENQKVYNDLMIQISFFQHARPIHLIVTVTFAILTIIGIIACLFVQQISLYILR